MHAELANEVIDELNKPWELVLPQKAGKGVVYGSDERIVIDLSGMLFGTASVTNNADFPNLSVYDENGVQTFVGTVRTMGANQTFAWYQIHTCSSGDPQLRYALMTAPIDV